MAKTVNNVKVNTTFTTATAREQLTSGENLCTSLGKINKYLADLDTGAFTFPANGGNADTVDGKHAADFMQNLGYLTTGSLLDYVLTLTSSGSFFIGSNVTDTPISGLFYGVDVIRHAGGDYVITATRFNSGGVWTNRYNAGAKKWYGWANVADGGNADTVDGKHASDFTLSYIRNNKPLVTSILTLEKTARLKWLPVDGATKYAVALYINGKYVNQSTEITNTYYDIQGLTPGTVYLALVQAYVNNSWSKFTTDDLVHFYTMPAASATSDGLVTTGSQTFAGDKTFQGYVDIKNPDYTKSSTAPSTIKYRAHRFLDSAKKVMGELSNYVDTKNNTVSKLLATAAGSLDNKVYSQIATLINADASYICHVCTTPTIGVSSLRQMASGTAEATTSNCPDGAWYGQYEEV